MISPPPLPPLPPKTRTCRCAYADCGMFFYTTHPFKKYHSKKCCVRDAVERRAVMYRKTFGMSEKSYRTRQKVKNGTLKQFKPHRSPKVEDKVVCKAFSLPKSLIQRLKNFPHVNWSGEVSRLLSERVGKMELT